MKSVTISGLTNDQLYGFRMFPANLKGQYQTRNDRGTAEGTPKRGIGGIDSYTQLMLHLDNDLIDSSLSPKVLSQVNTPTFIDPAKFGGGVSLSAAAGLATYAYTSDMQLGIKNWTFDWWEYRTGIIEGTCIANTGPAHSQAMLLGYIQGGSLLLYAGDGTGFNILSAKPLNGTVPLNQWVHRALVRNGVSLIAFQDGRVTLRDTLNANANFGNLSQFTFGGGWGSSQNAVYVDEFRMSVGVARWLTDFDPYNEPYTV